MCENWTRVIVSVVLPEYSVTPTHHQTRKGYLAAGSAFARPAEIIEQKVDASGVSYYVHYSDGTPTFCVKPHRLFSDLACKKQHTS